jgi:catechol 2,3-dioxygenase-like lactoylglutathione lyase family enzyme
MAIELNHTIVPAHDPQASAQFLAGILGLTVDRRWRTSPP